MRFDAVLASALYSSALFLGQVHADDAEDTLESSSTSAVESSTSSAVEKPTFTVSPLFSPYNPDHMRLHIYKGSF